MFKFWYLMIVLSSGQEQFVVSPDAKLVRFNSAEDCQVQIVNRRYDEPTKTYKCRAITSTVDLSKTK